MKPFLTAIALALFGALLLAAAAQDPAPITVPRQSPAPPLVIRSTYGADLYQFYCSTCHGPTAHGGTARSTLQPAPDLTALARRNDGLFPRDRIRDSITFGPGASRHGSHGTADMPVWGTVFRGLDQNDTMTAIRIENLVNYLASLQDREGGQ